MTIHDRLMREFARRFNAEPAYVVRAPGRVNLIGEHTDYNDGFVLPMTIDRAAWIALRPRSDQRVVVHSLDFKAVEEFDLAHFSNTISRWAEYIKGVAWSLQHDGYNPCGWDGVVAGDVPIGAGLSSSAALELATARAFAAVSGFEWKPTAIAKLCQRAENHWVGVDCGIMDQLISACGQAGCALLIDCRSLTTKSVPLPTGIAIVVLDTATRRSLVGSAYNDRRAQCEAAARFFGVPALRDVTLPQFESRAAALDEVIRPRARHVITENERTIQAAAAMQSNDAECLGQLMNASHESLRDDFEVSSHELNVITDCARAADGCLGARMTGAGFGGCAVALVRTEASTKFVADVDASYRAATGLTPHFYVCHATNGAEIIGPR